MQSESRIPHYGGQALIEGVLMRGKSFVVAAMRKPDNTIHLEYEKLEGIYTSRSGKNSIFTRTWLFCGIHFSSE